eukprot:Skav226114  [mRNA]  locus=scaffold1047:5375:7650:+ [translate_table: standard]
MGQVRSYEAQPTEIPDQFTLNDFTFKLVTVEVANAKAKDFGSKYKLQLPAAIRARSLFDKNVIKQTISMQPSPKPPKTQELPPWTDEPVTIEQLTNTYNEYQEAAQYLAGPEFPTAILEGLLKKIALSSKSVRSYEAQPTEIPDQFTLNDFTFKLVTVEVANAKAKDFGSKYKFDKNVIKQSISMQPSPKPPKTQELPPWTDEPVTIEQLTNTYNVEAKAKPKEGTTIPMTTSGSTDESNPSLTSEQVNKLAAMVADSKGKEAGQTVAKLYT